MGRGDWFGDPMEVALVQLAADALPELPHSRRLNGGTHSCAISARFARCAASQFSRLRLIGFSSTGDLAPPKNPLGIRW
jgi:hypothetical protein